jgi:hypothetical protein
MDLKKLLFLICTCCYISLISSQLTPTDINYIKKTVLSSQDESTGIFSKSLDTTYKSVYVLQSLDEQVPLIPKICREISFEIMNKVTEDIINLNEALNCKLPITGDIKDEQLLNINLDILYPRALLAKYLKSPVNWSLLFDNVKAYMTDLKVFSNVNGSGTSSILSTAYGLKLFSLIHEQIKDAEIKNAIIEEIHNVLISLVKEMQTLRDVFYY